MKFNWVWLIFPCVALLAACDERYRYPCQDPENWESKMCKKPYCSANGTCPEDLKHYEKDQLNGTLKMPATNQCQQSINTGACK